jgi:hypothetical protein
VIKRRYAKNLKSVVKRELFPYLITKTILLHSNWNVKGRLEKYMSFLLGRGDEAKEALKSKGGGIDFKKAFIRLKAGESRRVRVLTAKDYVAYLSHGHFGKGVHTQPCIAPTGERCLHCEAKNYDGEKDKDGNSVWNMLYAKKRVLFGLVDLDEGENGMIRFFDATKKQGDGIIAAIEEYADDLDDMAFTLKRTGEKNETAYTLNPIMPKKMAEVQDVFDQYDETDPIKLELFEEVLQARTTDEQAQELQKAGFPVKDFLGYDVKIEEPQEGTDEDAGEPIDEEDEDLTKNM